ncbi:hypothetical protein DL96DRAFT_1585705 [Flagelloscypha sp. PMI_526]|nr:hypothetical protein DL96DRAFT_1585705 [Flagelloscypha sp. PMI_526]
MSLEKCAPEILRQILAHVDPLTVSRWTYLNKTVSPVAVEALYTTLFPNQKQMTSILAHSRKNIGFVRVLVMNLSTRHSLCPQASDWAQFLETLNEYKSLRALEFKSADWQNKNPAIHRRLIDTELKPFTPELWTAFVDTLNLPSLERVTIAMTTKWYQIPLELVPSIMNCGAFRDLLIFPYALGQRIPAVDSESRSKLQTLRVRFGQWTPVDAFSHVQNWFILDSLKRLSFHLHARLWPEEDFLTLFATASQVEELSILGNENEWYYDRQYLPNFSIASLTCLRHLTIAFIVQHTHNHFLGLDVLSFPLRWINDRILSTIPSSTHLESLKIGFRVHDCHEFYDDFYSHPEWRRLSELLDKSPSLHETNVVLELCDRFPGGKEFTFETNRIAEVFTHHIESGRMKIIEIGQKELWESETKLLRDD